MSEKLRIWEMIMQTAIDNRDKYPIGSEGYKAASQAVETLQEAFTAQFGRRFTYGTYSE